MNESLADDGRAGEDGQIEGHYGITRRLLLLGAGLTAASLAAPTFAAASTSAAVPTSPEEKMRLLLRLAASAGKVSVPWFYTGRIYAIREGIAPLHLYNFEGSEIYWITPMGANAWYMAVSTLTFYRDRETNAYLDQFANPISGKTVKVSANTLRSKPGQGATYAQQSFSLMGDTQPVVMEIHRSAEVLWLTTSRNTGHGAPPAMEINTLFGAAPDVDDAHNLTPRATFSSVSLSRWSQWLQMGDTDGHLLWHAAGRKLKSIDELPDSYRQRAQELAPVHFTNPETSPAAAAPVAAPIAAPASAAALNFSYVVGAGGVPLSVAQTGEANAAGILFVHGLGQSHLSFKFQLRGELAARYHLVAFDLRGHGNSGKPWDEAAYSGTRAYADDIAKVIAATGLKRPLIVAWSYGTLCTADYVRHFGTDNIAGIVMIGALGGLASLPPTAFDPAVMASMKNLHDLGASPGLENTLRASHDVIPFLTARPISREWTATSETVNALLPPFARTVMGARMMANNTDLIDRIHVPTLLTAGSEDHGTPESLMQTLAARLPQSKVKVYTGSGHSPFAEDPEQFNRDLLEFAKLTLSG